MLRNIENNTSLSGPEVDEAEKVDEGETGEREGLADRFYQDVLNRPLLSEAKRRAIDGYFREIVTNIAADDRVESPEAAHEVLTDAFGGVKKKVAPIWSHKIMTEDYGEKAIEEAIKAKSVSSLSESSSFPSVEPTREPAPTEPKDSPSKSHNNSAALPAAAELNPTDYDTPQAYVYAYCRASVHQKKLTPQELTKLFRAVKGRITQDEIERMHRVERENVYGRRAA